jgi:HTH-type transcriptional regulator / antitoxin HigA
MIEERSSYRPDVAVLPGETLLETIEALGMSQADLARRAGRPLKTINEIVQGKAAITADTALHLEQALGVPAGFWIALERNYQERLARLRARECAGRQIDAAKNVRYAELAKLGWLPPTRHSVERVENLLRFFGVTSLDLVPQVETAAFRKQAGRQADPWALAAWLRRGELECRELRTAAFDAPCARAALPELRALTRMENASWAKDLVGRCARIGVALVFVPHLAGTYAHGATRWLGGKRPVVQMSIRGKHEDIFWFSFFHEMGHILLHGKRETFLDGDVASPDESREKEADRFASDVLIPPRRYAEWAALETFSEKAVRHFAEEIGVAPGIVVGRLQHDGRIPYSQLNHLRRKLAWVEGA